MANGNWLVMYTSLFSFFYFKSTFLWHTKSRRRFKMDEKNVIDDDDDDTTRYSGAARRGSALALGYYRAQPSRAEPRTWKK